MYIIKIDEMVIKLWPFLLVCPERWVFLSFFFLGGGGGTYNIIKENFAYVAVL